MLNKTFLYQDFVSTRKWNPDEEDIWLYPTMSLPFLSWLHLCCVLWSLCSCPSWYFSIPGTSWCRLLPGSLWEYLWRSDLWMKKCTHCPSVTQRNCFHHLELCLSNLFDSLSLLPSYPPRWLLFKASFVFICTNPKADLALTSHKLTCWVF